MVELRKTVGWDTCWGAVRDIAVAPREDAVDKDSWRWQVEEVGRMLVVYESCS
jgi:hypothetical protein